LAEKVTSPYLQSWLIDHFDAFCYAPFADHDYALQTPGEPWDNLFDIDKPGIYCVIPSGWPGFSYDIYYSFCIVGFSRYAIPGTFT